jgi:hypothetical protein
LLALFLAPNAVPFSLARTHFNAGEFGFTRILGLFLLCLSIGGVFFGILSTAGLIPASKLIGAILLIASVAAVVHVFVASSVS